MNFKSKISNIAKDIFNLEINTIIKATITSGKMPPLGKALEDIGKKYDFKLTQLGSPLDKDKIIGSKKSFEDIISLSRSEINKLKQSELDTTEEENYWMLYRIKQMSEAILNVFNKNDEIINTPDTIVLIRKTWELGVEEVVMKTVIQLDGDVITRIKKGYAIKEYSALHEIHNLGVSTSVKFWKTLVDIIGSISKFVGSFIKS